MRVNRSNAVKASIALMACLALAIVATAEKNQPELEVSVTSFDFGFVPQGTSITHAFWLKNIGGDTLLIQNIKPG